jgi:hypothetical protein
MHTSVADPGVQIAPGVAAALKSFTLPAALGFGAVTAPVMFTADWADLRWGGGRLGAGISITVSLPKAMRTPMRRAIFPNF